MKIDPSILEVAKMAWVAGDQLQGGKYTIEEELRRGRFGITYLVRNKNNDRQIIKTLDANSITSLSQSDRNRLETMFYQEAVKLTRCQHQHIVKYTDFFKEVESSCLVMEYVDGINLDKRSQLQIPEQQALVYIRQIGKALTVVHQNNLIHGDVRPENIILRGGKPEAVLIDFDLALDFDHELTTRRARENANGFAPPELYAKSTKPTAASDIYSLAATFYVLLTGRIPVDALKRKLDNIHLPEPKEINPQISDRINQAILNGMALEAKDRPQSMQLWTEILSYKSSIPNAEVKGDNVEAENPRVTPPPLVEHTHTKEVISSRPTVNKETILNKPARTIPWALLTIVLLAYCIVGYILAASNAPFLVWAVTVAVAGAVFWVRTGRTRGRVELDYELSEWQASIGRTIGRTRGRTRGRVELSGAGALSILFILVVGIMSMFAGGSYLAGTVAGALLVTWGWALVGYGAEDELEKSFSKFHAFLILTGTSNLGLGLGWIIVYMLSNPS